MLKELDKKKKSLRKKSGDDKLVISLVLMAIGILLCFIYKNEIQASLENALKKLTEYVNSLLNGVNTTSTLLVLPIRNLFKF